MSGVAVSVGALAITATLALGCSAIGAAAAHATRVSAVADAAALAAADAASGAVSGAPCDRAAEVAGRGGAAVTMCTVDDLITTVRVEADFGLWQAAAQARAGPPP